jgi:hypothetical protein
MSNLLRSLREAKSIIQMQKPGAEVINYAEASARF